MYLITEPTLPSISQENVSVKSTAYDILRITKQLNEGEDPADV